MKKTTVYSAAAISILSGAAFAGGLDRTNTPIDIIFQDGNYAEVTYGYIVPSIDGKDLTGTKTKNVAKDYSVQIGGVKTQVNDKLSFSMIYDTPYGSSIKYKHHSPLIGGTRARSRTNAITILMRYKPFERFSVYGGPRVIRAHAEVKLEGLAYGPANGYKVKLGNDTAVGFVAGASYEIPDIALRVALTYHSEATLTFDTTETVQVPGLPGGLKIKSGNTTTKLPQSLELKAQTGITKSTLLFGSVRWSDWSVLKVTPPVLDSDLVTLRDAWTFTLGAGQRFTDKLSGSLTLAYEPVRGNKKVSVLAPTNGYYSAALGASYDLNEHVNVSGSIRYYIMGDGDPAIQGNKVAKFKNNNAVAFGMKVGYRF